MYKSYQITDKEFQSLALDFEKKTSDLYKSGILDEGEFIDYLECCLSNYYKARVIVNMASRYIKSISAKKVSKNG